MHICLYFGSFNPIHIGHLIIATQALNQTDARRVWFVVSPQNPFKSDSELLDENARLDLVGRALKGNKCLIINDIEFGLSKPSYTNSTLLAFARAFPQHRFSVLMGSDSFETLHQWKDFQEIIKQHQIMVYRRPGFDIINHLNANIEIIPSPLLDISSTAIRNMIKTGRSTRYLLPESVKREIEKKGYYS